MTTSATFFCCATCGVEITELLAELPEPSLRFERGASAIAEGRFIRLSSAWTYRDFLSRRQGGRSYLSRDGDATAFEAGDHLLNIEDVEHLVMPKAAYGCCGLQPRDEFNASCRNGHPIGTIHDDCWAASVFRLARGHVKIIDCD